MFLQLQQESILLGHRPAGFTEHYYTEWDDGLGKEKISLFLLMSIGSTQVPGAEIGKEAFQLLQDHFLDDLVGDPYDRFENALREVNAMVSEKEKELDLKFIPNMNVLIGVIQKDMLFLSQRGEAQGYLVRKRHVSSITDGLYDEKNKEDLFQNIASGVLEVGDSTVLVTGPLVQYVTPNDLSKIFSEQPLRGATKELEDLLHSDIEDQMSLVAFEVLEKAEEVVAASGPTSVKLESEEVYEEREEEEENSASPNGRFGKGLAALQKFAAYKDRFQFLDKIRSWEKKKLLITIGALVLVLALGIFILNTTLGKQRTINAMQEKLATAEDNIALAETKGAFDKAEANVLLNSAEDLAVEVLESGYLGVDVSTILDLIQEQRDYLDNVQHITDDLKLVADLSGDLAGASLLGVQPYGDRIVAFSDQSAFQILIDQVEEPDVLDATERMAAGRFFDEYNSIVFITQAAKLIEYTDGNSQFADTSDVTWHSGVDIATYSNKIYVLDAVSNQIWRYARGTEAYGSAQGYFSGEVDLSKAISLAVDGSIWLLNNDGTIVKYLSGELLEFAIKKAPLEGMTGATRLYTELEVNQVYVLDPANDRLFIFDKATTNNDITYNAQYIFDDIKGTLVDVFVDKDRNVIVLATTSAVYELSFE